VKEKILAACHPNCGVEAAYRKAILKLVEEMGKSFSYWLVKAYKNSDPEMAQDANAAQAMKAAINKLIKRWQKRFDYAAPRLAKWFALKASKRSDSALMHILRKGGISVKFKPTKAQKEILQATVEENVALIKSIPQKYHHAVVPLVMNSVRQGRDLSELTKELQKQFKVTKNRAVLIARDQNNKATGALTRARQMEMGIKEAVWLHSGGGRKPRPTHVKNSGKRYDVNKGWYDPHEGKRIHPGELINCRCVSKSVIPGFM
jgi:SPP1 gp7 family putative phage head morphogenesis protein